MKKFTVKNSGFIDKDGNPVILKGINMVCKDKSRGYIGDYSEEDFAYLASLGFNVIRFGIFWDALEPEPGKYNDEYLRKISAFSATANRYGLSLYLDMHQDLFSSDFCDGAPSWATITNGESYEKTDLWSEAYLTCPAVQIAFDNFWTNTPASDGIGIQDHYIAMWQHIADFFKNDENIIGYDVLNEPFPGTAANGLIEMLFSSLAMFLMENPSILSAVIGDAAIDVTYENIGDVIMSIWMNDEKKEVLLSYFTEKSAYKSLVAPLGETLESFDSVTLTAFYQNIRNAVRKVDSEAIIFIEANYFCNTGVPSGVVPPSDEQGLADPYMVYAPHGYDLMVDTDMYSADCHTRLDVIFETHAEYGKVHSLPVIIGEWGCYPNADSQQKNEASYLLKKFESLNFSNTYYDFSTIKDNPIVDVLKAK